jgi:phosphatidate cytidylyltransferase
VIICGIVFHPVVFYAVFALVTALTVYEFCGLTNRFEQTKLNKAICAAGGLYIFTATFLTTNGYVSEKIFLPYLLFMMISFISELYRKAPNPINNWGFFLFSQIYCAGSFALLNLIGQSPANPSTYSPTLILAVFIFIWINDTGAYLFGSKFGKRRLFERISPKKSWEGFFGGLATALVSSQAFAHYCPEISWINWLGLSLAVVVFGTYGDLVESLFKRNLAVKDSGNILPGHGGMLDRFDSVIMAIPAAYLYMELFLK